MTEQNNGGVVTQTTHQPQVFVTNYAGHDYTQAEKFGKLVFLTRGFVDFYSLDRVKFTLAKEIMKSTKDDYLLLSGSSYVCVVLALLWMQRHNQIKILNFDKATNGYREAFISDKNIDQMLDVLSTL